MNNAFPWYVLTGGPCSGKTTLIDELKQRGYSVFPEPARIVIASELAQGKTIQDILAYYRKFNLSSDEVLQKALASVRYRKVFLLDMIEFANDAERYETPQEAAILHEFIREAYTGEGYDIIKVPVVPVPERADFILKNL